RPSDPPVFLSTTLFRSASTPEVGVKVAVQVTPPLEDDTAVSVPLAIVRSALVKPVTASLKVTVNRLVSPIFKAVSLKVMLLTVGHSETTALICKYVVPL